MVRISTSPTNRAHVPAQLAAQQLPGGGAAAAAKETPGGGGGAPGVQLNPKPMTRQPQRQMPHAMPMGPMLRSGTDAPASEVRLDAYYIYREALCTMAGTA